MNSYYDSIVDWSGRHPTALALILFALGCVISLYSKEIRKFLHTWPRTSNAIDNISYKMMKHDLAEIEALHNNTYNLVFYALSLFVAGTTRIVVVVGAIYLLNDIAKSPMSTTAVIGLSLGMFMGRVGDLRRLVDRLINYEKSSAFIKNEIAKYEKDHPPASSQKEPSVVVAEKD